MARLGSVVGAVLAELARARAISDEMTRDLVDRYEADPVLASLSVPRVSLGEASISLRFVIDDVEEPDLPQPDPSVTRDAWSRHLFAAVLPDVVARLQLDPKEREEVLSVLVGAGDDRRDTPVRPPIGDVRSALLGDHRKLLEDSVSLVSKRFDTLSPALRRRIGKTLFTQELTAASEKGITRVVRDIDRDSLIAGALASKVNVAVTAGELPSDPQRLQELRLTLRSEDLETVLDDPEVR